MSRNKGKVVVIMGASSGIGAATAKKLVEGGAKIVIAARREERLKEIVDSYPNADILYKTADVRIYDEVKAVIDLAVEKFGRIDAIFNNAGIMPLANLAETRLNEWQDMIDINITGVLNGIAAVLPIMKEQGNGHILATDSVAGHVIYPTSAVYCGTKFAVRAIMEGLRQEERENGIRSTIVSPGLVDTELYTTVNNKKMSEYLRERGKVEGIGLTPESVADAIIYALEQPESVAISEVIIRPSKQVD
jgi:NADP-dependent 3-hydroxy acid dehydrogenase YdfG